MNKTLHTVLTATATKAAAVGLIVGAVLTSIAIAHDSSSSSDAPAPDAVAAAATERNANPFSRAPMSGPNSELLVDRKGNLLVIDEAKLTNQLIESLDIEQPAGGSQAIIVYYEHLPELYAAGVVTAVPPGDPSLAAFCTTESVNANSCALQSRANLNAASRSGSARMVDPTSFRGD